MTINAPNATSARATLTTTGGGPWTPASLASGVEWWNAADTAKITASGGFASQVNGQLGVHNLSQGTASLQPGSGSTTISGKNVLVFDDTDDTMAKTSVALTQPLTAWLVFQATDLAGHSTRHDWMMGGGGMASLFQLAGKYTLYAGSATAGTLNTGTTAHTQAHLIIGVFNGASSAIYIDATADTGLNPGTVGTTELRFGPSTNPAAYYFCAAGYTSSAMGATDRGNLRTWAQTQWGAP